MDKAKQNPNSIYSRQVREIVRRVNKSQADGYGGVDIALDSENICCCWDGQHAFIPEIVAWAKEKYGGGGSGGDGCGNHTTYVTYTHVPGYEEQGHHLSITWCSSEQDPRS